MSINQQHFEQFCTVLSSIMDHDNTVRRAAESQLNSIPVESRAQLLLHVLTSQATVELKKLACVTLKMVFVSSLSKKEISQPTFAYAKQCIPQLVVGELDGSYRKKLVSLMSSLIEVFYEDGKNTWEESVNFVINCINSNESRMHEIALTLIIYFPTLFGDKSAQVLPQLVRFIMNCLQNFQAEPSMSVLSIEALGMIAEVNNDKSSLKIFSQLVPLLLVATQSLAHSKEGLQCMSSLTYVLEYNTRIFKNHVSQVVEVLLGLLNSPNVATDVKYDTFEALVTYVQKVPGQIKKTCPKHIPLIINHAYNMLTEIEDDQLAEWIVQFDELAEDNLSDSAYYGETSLDRIACALRGETVLPIALQKVTEFLQNPNWKHQDAALVSLGAIAEGCRKQMKPMLPQIVKIVTPFFANNNPKIVFSTINTIGQLSSDYPGYFHNHFHSQVFPLIFKVAESHNFVKVQAQAVFAFVNVIDGCSDELLNVYAPTICQLLVNISATISLHMNVPGVHLLIRAVTNAMAHLCGRTGLKFEPFAPNFIQNLFSILDKVSFEPTHHEIINQILDCLVGIVASHESEGAAERYIPTILKYVELFGALSDKTPDDSAKVKLKYYSLLTKMADIGSNCLTSILPKLLPSLLNYLSTCEDDTNNNGLDKSLVAAGTAEDDYDPYGIYSDDYMNDKCVVCDLISTLAENLKASFAHYVEACLQVLLVIFPKSVHIGIRTSITNCLPPLLNSLILNGNLAYALNVWNANIKNVLLLALTDDPDEEFFGDLLEDFTRCVTHLGGESLNVAEIKYLGEVFNAKIVELIQYDIELSQAKQLQGDDEEDDEMFDDFEVDQIYLNDIILQSLQSCAHDMFVVFKQVFLTAIEPMYKTLLACLTDERSDMYIRFSFCIFDDVVEFAPQSAPNIYVDFMPKMLHYLQSKNPDLRQVVVFGLGMLAQNQVSNCYNYLSQSIPVLVSHISDATSRHPENVVATENCIAAYGRYIRFVPQLFNDPMQEMKNWLGLLPVLEDEVDFCLGYLCDLIDATANVIFQNHNDKHNTHILHSIVSMLLECDDSNVCKKAVATIVQLQNVFPTQLAQSLNSLDKVQKSNFDRIIKTHHIS